MTALDDALAELRTAAAGQVDAAVALTVAATRQAADAQQVLALAARVAALAGTTAPEPGPKPGQAPNVVRVGTKSYPLAAVNPTPASNPAGFVTPSWAGRGPDQLIAVQSPWSKSGTNRYGSEAALVGGRFVGAITVGGAGGITVPDGGVVLSGNGLADRFLQQAFAAGGTVELLRVDQPAPGPAPTPVPGPAGRTLSVYLMDGVGHVSQVPEQCTQIRVAFVRDGGLVEWGGDSPAQTAAALTAWRSGRRAAGLPADILLSIGGEGGPVTVSRIPAVVRGLRSFAVDGIDWDLEAGALPVAEVVAASRDLARGREASWVTSFVPPGGGPVALALDAARQCQAAGLRVQFGQQTYWTQIDDGSLLSAVKRAVDALGPEAVVVGMMFGDPQGSWTLDNAESRMRALLQRWPGLAGSYLWESARAGTSEWARRVGAVLGL